MATPPNSDIRISVDNKTLVITRTTAAERRLFHDRFTGKVFTLSDTARLEERVKEAMLTAFANDEDPDGFSPPTRQED